MSSMILQSLAMLCFLLTPSTRGEKIDEPTLKSQALFWGGAADVIREQVDRIQMADRDKIAEAWFTHVWSERDFISSTYKSKHCPEFTFTGAKNDDFYCPLSTCFNRISTGDLKNLYESSFAPPDGILARTVKNSIKGKLKEMGGIEEVVCANDKEMKDKIASFYQNEFQVNIKDDLAKFREDDKDYTKALTKHCWEGLCQDKKINPKDAEKEANALRAIDCANDKEGFKKKLTELFDTKCEPDLKLIFQKYRRDKDGIENAVEKVYDVERQRRVYNVLVRYIENTCLFYANQLDSAMDGFGTDETRINRIVLTRCERDLACILKKYKEAYGKTFQDRLKDDCFGEWRYHKAIKFLCGG